MERLKELITKLDEQVDRKVETALLLETTQLIEAEIRLLASQPPAPARVMPTKIAVMMPSSTKMKETIAVAAPATPAPAPAAAAPAPTPTPAPAPAAIAASAAVPAPSAAASAPAAAVNGNHSVNGTNGTAVATAVAKPPVKAERGQWPFDPLAEKPTDRFTLSQKAKEVNDVIGTNGMSSLNDKLRSDATDLKSTLNESPVRDLKKAIGVNDRYLFINQLFRGDEVMYERSLKTINGFRILPEAEYWMERELKVKLGWDENRETTRHFYQLVKRRFS
ncbi:MAG: hypothetical protein JST68_25745 [Bacteroidetes bacterium]|nr:hypothetical protein [Bacteroidota bacterium]